MHPTTIELLSVLSDLASDNMLEGLVISRDDAERGSPFDSAIFAWADAGCPDAPRASESPRSDQKP